MTTTTTIGIDRWRSHLSDHLGIARRGTDPEGVHQMRVAIARLRVWIALGDWPSLDEDLRWLRAQVAEVRDLDVQLEHNQQRRHRPKDLPKRLASSLKRRRQKAQTDLVKTFDSARARALIATLSTVLPISRKQAMRALPQLASRVLDRVRQAKRRHYRPKSLHRVRCVVRHLRFALEWIELDATDLVKLQDVLGHAYDIHVALETARKASRSDKKIKSGRAEKRYRAKLARREHQAIRAARIAIREARPHLRELAAPSDDDPS